jgi:CP family cyanate transporter-like MFS transporter
VLALAWTAAFSLRTGFIGLGPILPDLAADIGLSSTAASTLVSVPTLMMGLVAVAGGALADRWGPARAIALGLAAVALGGGLRAATGSWPPLLLATVCFGAGIGIAQPALPRLVRGLFPGRIGRSTGIYASGLIAGSILAASLTLPVEDRYFPQAGWRGPLLLWGLLAAATLAVWLALLRPWAWPGSSAIADPVAPIAPVPRNPNHPQLRATNRLASATSPVLEISRDPAVIPAEPQPTTHPQPTSPPWSPWRDRDAWAVAMLFAAQGLAYYLMVAWLPAVYRELGVDAGRTGALVAIFNGATLPAILGFPILSDRLGSRRLPCLIAALLFTSGALGYVLAPTTFPLAWLWPILAGSGVSALFAMGLVLPTDVAPAGQVGAAAGMVLAVGYAGSALGPVLAGAVRDLTGGFETALATLPIVGLLTLLLAAVVPPAGGRPRATAGGG